MNCSGCGRRGGSRPSFVLHPDLQSMFEDELSDDSFGADQDSSRTPDVTLHADGACDRGEEEEGNPDPGPEVHPLSTSLEVHQQPAEGDRTCQLAGDLQYTNDGEDDVVPACIYVNIAFSAKKIISNLR